MTVFLVFKRQLFREIRIQLRQLRVILNSCLFFLMVMVFFPLTIPPDTNLLRTLVPGLVWIAMLLAMFLSAERLFQSDYEEGVIEQWLLSSVPISLFVTTKMAIHWLLTLGPMLLLCPFLAIFFALSPRETVVLMASLICGTPAILSLCTLAASFGTGLKQNVLLMPIILLPLTIPIMIFGSGTLHAAMEGLPVLGYLALLLAISLVTVTFIPFAVAGVIRVNCLD